jgi:hypothetical protein
MDHYKNKQQNDSTCALKYRFISSELIKEEMIIKRKGKNLDCTLKRIRRRKAELV